MDGASNDLIFFMWEYRKIVYMATHVLYVASDKSNPSQMCRGSSQCISVAKHPSLKQNVLIQNVDILRRKQPLPSWLNGTPILVDRTTNQIIKGSPAIDTLKDMQRQVSSQENEIFVEVHGKPGPSSSARDDRVENSGRRDELQPTPPSARGPTVDLPNVETMGYAHEEDSPPSDLFSIDTEAARASESARSEKVTEEDLQRLIEAREKSIPSTQQTPPSGSSMPPPLSGKE